MLLPLALLGGGPPSSRGAVQMTSLVRAFVNGRGVDAPAGGTALDAVRALDATLAEQVADGERALTDSRGLPIAADSPLVAGAIYRVVPVRKRSALDAPE